MGDPVLTLLRLRAPGEPRPHLVPGGIELRLSAAAEDQVEQIELLAPGLLGCGQRLLAARGDVHGNAGYLPDSDAAFLPLREEPCVTNPVRFTRSAGTYAAVRRLKPTLK